MARVLVVDDEAAMRDMIALAVEMDGHQVEQAYDTTSAISMYLETNPDLLILDLHMPGGGGGEVIRQLALSDGGLCPTIVVTGFASDLTYDLQALMPSHRLVEKPFNLERFRGVIREMLTV